MAVKFSDKKLLPTKKAAELTGYSQDYIGQLCRGQLVKCYRIGRQWFIDYESLKKYAPKMKKPKQKDFVVKQVSEEKDTPVAIKDTEANLIELNGEIYISTKKASELTGYAQDYISQLARKKEIPSYRLGKRWFVHKDKLLEHKKEKDSLLQQVQAESVGLKRKTEEQEDYSVFDIDLGIRYIDDMEEKDRDLLPKTTIKDILSPQPVFAGGLTEGQIHYSVYTPAQDISLKKVGGEDTFLQKYKNTDNQTIQAENKYETNKKTPNKSVGAIITTVKLVFSISIFLFSLFVFLFVVELKFGLVSFAKDVLLSLIN